MSATTGEMAWEQGPVLVVGLGSMGKRRLRNLKALGVAALHGFDARADRRAEVEALGGVTVHASFDDAIAAARPDALVISVPPDVHHVYMERAVALRIPFFVEASVIADGMEEVIAAARAKGVFAAPSSTMWFHPAVRRIVELVRGGYLGRISNVLYHMGNYLPDWHTYERVSDFYVSKKETGGAREIVPFELTWLTKLFGFPQRVCGLHRRTIDIPGAPDIDDTYNVLLDQGTFSIVLTVDVVTRSSIRRMLINGSERELIWNWDDGEVRVFHHDKQEWEVFAYQALEAASGYNRNITEGMYIDEMAAFLAGIKAPHTYVNTLEDDLRVLRLLQTIEASGAQGKFLVV